MTKRNCEVRVNFGIYLTREIIHTASKQEKLFIGKTFILYQNKGDNSYFIRARDVIHTVSEQGRLSILKVREVIHTLLKYVIHLYLQFYFRNLQKA